MSINNLSDSNQDAVQMQEQIQKTYEALKIILGDEETFNHVCMEVFKSIDINGDESLEKDEVVKFIETIC